MSESRNDDTRKPDTDDAAELENDAPAGSTTGQVPDDDTPQAASPPEATGDASAGESADTPDPSSGEDGAATPAGAAAPPRRRGGRLLAALALLFALAATAAAGVLGWRLYQLEQRVASIPAERSAALESYLRPDALRPLRSRIESLEAQREELAGEVRQRVERLQESVESVRSMTERHQIGWRLAEIRYLLSVAARRLLIARDTEGAEAALAAADASLAELRDVRLLPLREAIVEDLGAVRAVQPADIEGIALRLQSLLARVESLPRTPLRSSDPDDAEAGADGWWERLRRQLGDFVVIQRRSAGPAPVEPKVDDGLRPTEALTLALQDARRAALTRDEERFGTALDRAADVLERHFDPQAGATIRFSEGLSELRGRSVDTDLPDLTGTLELAQRLAREVEQAARETVAPDGQPNTEEEQ